MTHSYGADNVKDILNLDAPITKGIDFEKIIHPEDLNWNLSQFAHAIEKNTIFDIEFRIIDRNRNVFGFWNQASLISTKQVSRTHVIGVVQDITEQKSLRDWNLAQNRALQLIADGDRYRSCLLPSWRWWKRTSFCRSAQSCWPKATCCDRYLVQMLRQNS